MSDTETLPQGGEGAAAPAITDERSAAIAIEGLLGDYGESSGDDGDTESSATAPDAGPDENRTPGEEEGQSEPEADRESDTAPTLAPPNSWSSEEKDLFGKLPPEAQQAIVRRDSEQRALVTKTTQEIAEERKGWDAERTAIQSQRQQYLTNLQRLTQLALPEAQAFEGINWQKLAAEQPGEYVRLTAARDELRGRVQALFGEQQRVEQAAQAEHEQRFQALRAEQGKKLIEAIPDFGDKEKAPKLTADLRGYLASQYGFTPEEIGGTVDHRMIRMAVDALRAHQAATARQSAEAKRQNPPPQVQRPGNAQRSDTTAVRAKQEGIQRLRRTGSVRDAAALIELDL